MKRRTAIGLSVVLIVLIISLFSIFLKSQEKINWAEEEVVKLINYDYELKRIDRFYWTTIDDTYFGALFVDKDNYYRYALVEQEGGNTYYYDLQDLMDEQAARDLALTDVENSTVLNSRLGMKNQKAVWEITLKASDEHLTYYYIDAESGEWLESYSNI